MDTGLDVLEFEVYWADEFAGIMSDTHKEQVFHNTVLDYMFKLTPLEFLTQRVMPAQNWRPYAAEFYGLDAWDPVEICKLTHGYMKADYIWVKFPGEPEGTTWEFVKYQIW